MAALLLVDELLKCIDEYECFKQMLVFVTGPPSSGKTTLGDNLGKSNNFIHWDADLINARSCPMQYVELRQKSRIMRSKYRNTDIYGVNVNEIYVCFLRIFSLNECLTRSMQCIF